MQLARSFSVIDSHTAGHPTRVVFSGLPVLKGETVKAQRDDFRDHHDGLRGLLLHEPRGHAAMVGAVPVSSRTADYGVFFISSALVVVANHSAAVDGPLLYGLLGRRAVFLIKAEMFPADIRALGVALPFAIANVIFGGTAEYVALYLKNIGHERWFYIYISALAACSLVAYIRMRETKTSSLILED